MNKLFLIILFITISLDIAALVLYFAVIRKETSGNTSSDTSSDTSNETSNDTPLPEFINACDKFPNTCWKEMYIINKLSETKHYLRCNIDKKFMVDVDSNPSPETKDSRTWIFEMASSELVSIRNKQTGSLLWFNLDYGLVAPLESEDPEFPGVAHAILRYKLDKVNGKENTYNIYGSYVGIMHHNPLEEYQAGEFMSNTTLLYIRDPIYQNDPVMAEVISQDNPENQWTFEEIL